MIRSAAALGVAALLAVGAARAQDAAGHADTAINSRPGASPQELFPLPGTFTPLQLVGFDPEGDPLRFGVVSPPVHGLLTVDPDTGSASYVGPFGSDSFAFAVSDGLAWSEPAVVSVLVGFACSNGVDDDGDGRTDISGGDPGCASSSDTSERGTNECDDGIDNDGDQLVDHPADPACLSASLSREASQCQDGLDNDGQPGVDFDGGVSVRARDGLPADVPDPHCSTASRNTEAAPAPPGCGLGPELVPVVSGLALALLRKKRGASERLSAPESRRGWRTPSAS